jgi:DNA polymerase-3 subunit alpha
MWNPINCKTHFSLQHGFCKTDKLAERCAEYGYTACGIADFETLSGAVEFQQDCKKNGIKPIIGCQFDGYILYAKNKDGWFDLVKYVSNKTLDVLKEVANNGNVLCVTKEKNGFANLFKSNHIQLDYEQHAVYYVDQSDAECHRIMLCGKLKSTIKKINKVDHDFKEFFDTSHKHYDTFHLTDQNSTFAKRVSTVGENDVWRIVDRCEEYDLADQPSFPTFECPDGFEEDEYLTQLCRDGWAKLLIPSGKVKFEHDKELYADRIKQELKVIFKAQLSGYFLIVQDIIRWVREQGWLAGPGRGSAAGCLVSYLLGITEVDPIEYDLIFERFYNEGRNTDGNIAIPDIDMDVPAEHRDDVIDYIKQKYGEENVAQMITFGRLQGRSAIKEVLRVNDAVSFSEMNEITDSIEDEAQISDQLELMDDPSVIRWTLENNPKPLKRWVVLKEDGGLDGPLANLFEQAINIEGTNKSQGKHPAGVIISKHKLSNVCPMTVDKSNNPVVAFEMNPLEIQGHVKFDVLGIDLLSKIMEISEDD